MDLMPIPIRSFVFIALVFVLFVSFPFVVAYFKKVKLGWTGVFVSGLTALVLLIIFGDLSRRSLFLENGVIILKTTSYTKELPISKISRVETGDDCFFVYDYQKMGMGIPGFQTGWYVSGGLNYLVDFVSKPNICIYYNNPPEVIALEVSNPSEMKRLISD